MQVWEADRQVLWPSAVSWLLGGQNGIYALRRSNVVFVQVFETIAQDVVSFDALIIGSPSVSSRLVGAEI